MTPAERDTVAEYLAAHRQLETAAAHAEGEPTPMQPGPKLAAMTSAAARYAKAYQALAKLAEPAAASSEAADVVSRASYDPEDYNVPGHIDPMTGRLCMTVADAHARADSPDRQFWLYNSAAAASGLEGWRMVEGIDASTMDGPDGRPVGYSVDLASGSSRSARPGDPIYMQRTKEEREGANP